MGLGAAHERGHEDIAQKLLKIWWNYATTYEKDLVWEEVFESHRQANPIHCEAVDQLAS